MLAICIFLFFVGTVLGISFLMGAKAKSAKGYYAAHGQIHWFVNGVAFAGDYLSAASFLGICGMIALYGYDGFLYSIGFLAGWIVALFVIAEPMKRLGRFTFADALDAKFHSRGIKLSAAIATLIISVFYLIPQMVGAGALVKPLLGIDDIYGIIIVGALVTTIVVTAGMVSTTWVQFIKGGLLVIFCLILTVMILNRGLSTEKAAEQVQTLTQAEMEKTPAAKRVALDKDAHYFRVTADDGSVTVWKQTKDAAGATTFTKCQSVTVGTDGKTLTNGKPDGTLKPVGGIAALPNGQTSTGPIGPFKYLATLQDSTIIQWKNEKITEADGAVTTVYYPVLTPGKNVMLAGNSPKFKDLRNDKATGKINFFSFMLALFCGTASLPHILIRYYTVKDQASARKSTVIGIAAIGFFYCLTLYLGFAAMTSGTLSLADAAGNKAAPLLSKSFNEFLFALISAISFTTVLGTVSGLILAGSGAVAHDLMENYFKVKMNDEQKVRAGKITAIALGIGGIVLGILFQKVNVGDLVAWAFNIAASANLPALLMLLFWSRTTKQGIAVAVFVGMFSALGWILLSPTVFKDVYGIDPAKSIIPFSYPAIVTIPLSFAVLVVVSLLTQKTGRAKPLPVETVASH